MSAGPAEYAGLGEIYPGVELKVILEVLNKFYNSRIVILQATHA